MAKTTTTRKRTTTSTLKAVPKPAPEAEVAAVTNTDTGSDATTEDNVMRKRDLIDRVVEQSGVKKKDAKPAIEAALAILGEALSNEEQLNLPPLGKVMVNRKKELDNGEVLVVKLRRSKQAVEATHAPLEEGDD
ncbi:HU family DNA-binding protein [Rhodovulum sp. FJ3]|uniref:HU family DNA-binding protein n=1 Tax=Rhodovulum sp. FJ3 TaxID=3079053 RepID=UPI00293DF911|nr:HU family DNA-binding protein [Rhodovulum sp. FJ3]MDV4167772.1 HU family DNA-binding protein [Rhodovulum sp. FJ3]